MSNFFGILSQVRFQRIILVVLIAATYGVSLLNGFVWDDNIFFIDNPVYMDFNLRAIFLSLANGIEYLPLRDVTYAVDYLVWGKTPFGFHLTNLVIFTGNILLIHFLVQLLLKRITVVTQRAGSGFLPFAVAALFAVHPINAEVVNFVTCRNVLVSGLFLVLACVCIIRFFEEEAAFVSRRYAASLLAFVGAMLGKATAIMLPLLLLATLPVIFPGRFKRILAALTPFFVVAAGFFLVFRRIADTVGITDAKVFELNLFSMERKVVLALQIPFFYLKKLILPYGYSVAYENGFGARIFSPQVILAIAALVAVSILAVFCRKRFPEVTVGVCWYFTALVPVLNFFGTYPVVADRYAYLPTFGFLLVTVSLFDRVTASRLKLPVALTVGLVLAGVSSIRSLDWKSNGTLWSANIRNFPNNTKSYLNLANYYYNIGEIKRALDLLDENNKVPNLNMYSYFFRGKQLYEQNRLAEAKEQLKYVVDNIESGFIPSLYFLGLIAEREGDSMSAVLYYNKALNSQERDALSLLRYVRTNMRDFRKGWLDQYLSSSRQKVARNPGDLEARRDLALTLDRLEFYGEALEQYLALEHGGVKGWQIYHNIANCYYNMNNHREAASYYEKVITLGGGSEDTYNNLGVSYRKLEQYDKSIKLLEQATRLFPNASFPAYNLAVTYRAADQKDRARSSFEEVNRKFPDLKDRIAPHLLELSK